MNKRIHKHIFMKISRYTYLITKSDITYWFNGISKQYFALNTNFSKKLFDALQTELGQNELERQYPAFIKVLKEENFVIEDGKDEIQIIRSNFENGHNSKEYKLTILPTLNCNFNCWYCIQDHIESKMTPETIVKIKKHIIRIIQIDKIKSLNIDWFGGEPLMYFTDVIEPISRFAIEQCTKSGIPFSNTITTNAYYLTEQVCSKLNELKFDAMQITLDGKRSVHNKIKKAKNDESAFDIALNHINNALSASTHLTVLLRINYTKGTLNNELFDQICEHISIENRNRVQITLRKVWQSATDRNRKSEVRSFWGKAINNGFKVCANDFVDGIPCYADKKFYACINYNGEAVRCTACNDLYLDAPGSLGENGTIAWNKEKTKKFGTPNFENATCLSCKHLPLCLGGCNNHRHTPDEKFLCEQDNRDFTFEEAIENYIDYDTIS